MQLIKSAYMLFFQVPWNGAMVRPKTSARIARIEAPTLVLWGEADVHLESSLATPPSKLVPNARVEMIAGASHFVQHDAAERVNASLVAFLDEARA